MEVTTLRVMKVRSEQHAVWKSSPSTYRRGSE